MVIEWDYDRKLEKQLISDKELLEFAWAVRDVVDDNRLQIIISTRGIIATSKAIKSGAFTIEESLEGNLFENVKVDNLNKIIDGLENAGVKNNKYYKALVSLRDDMIKANKR
jgi:hypothetical protein